MYVDESGDTGLTNSLTNHFILSAIVIHETHWASLYEDLLNFRRMLKRTKGLRLEEEIHAKEFIRSVGKLQRIKRNDRLDIMKKCIDWLAERNEMVSVFSVSVEKTGKTDDIFRIAWLNLIQTFDQCIYAQQLHGNFPGDNRGIIISDNTDGNKLLDLVRGLRGVNVSKDAHKLFRMKQLEKIVEEAVMLDYRNSFFLQMVDVVAFCARQLFEPNSYMKKKGAGTFYRRLSPVLNEQILKKWPEGVIRV